MSEIKKGDLVVVVRGMQCCGRTTSRQGWIFSVDAMRVTTDPCQFCGYVAASIQAHGNGVWFDAYRLDVIQPLSESTETPTREELPVEIER